MSRIPLPVTDVSGGEELVRDEVVGEAIVRDEVGTQGHQAIGYLVLPAEYLQSEGWHVDLDEMAVAVVIALCVSLFPLWIR